MLQVVFNGPFLLCLRVLRPLHVASRQIKALLVLPMPVLERVLGRVAELTNGQADSFAQLDVRAVQLAADPRMNT